MADAIYDPDGNYVGTTDEYVASPVDTVVPISSTTPSGSGNGNTLSSLIAALGGSAQQVIQANRTQAQKKPASSNTMLYVIGAVVAVVVLVFALGGRRG